MRLVLDDELLSGAAAVELHLRPARQARAVDAEDYPAACAEIALACQLWGGMADVLVPVRDDAPVEPYPRLLPRLDADDAAGPLAAALRPGLPSDRVRRAPAMLAIAVRDRAKLRTLEVCDVEENDPWHLAYLGALGWLPEAPTPRTLTELMLPEDVAFHDVVGVRRASVAEPGLGDLLGRLRPTEAFTPRGFSFYGLTPRPARVVHSALDGWLDDPEAFARQTGSNVVVVYSPRDVEDLCLLWNLRGIHGWPGGLPLGVPAADGQGTDAASTLDTVAALLAAAGPGIGGWPVVLTSASLTEDDLAPLASALAERGQATDVVAPDVLLRPGTPPARTTSVSVVFDNGSALAATRTDKDRRDLAELARPLLKPDMHLTVSLSGEFVPPSATLRAGGRFGEPRFTGGGCTLDATEDGLERIHWPSGWTVVRALAADRGLTAEPSASGRTASALLAAVGGIGQIKWLAHRPLLALLYEKAASSGMGWWKERAAELVRPAAQAQTDPQAAMDALIQKIEDVSVSHGGESAATITYGELGERLGSTSAAAAWLEWAEPRRLVVRGTAAKCRQCQHEAWRPLASAAPPLVCPGCGREEQRPYEPSSMRFTYRLGEPLRRAIENDSIYHLLVMRPMAALLAVAPAGLVGLHPGVDFRKEGQQAEADVLAVLGDGAMVPVEVKLRSTGLRQHDLDMLDRLCDWLGATTAVLGTGDDDASLSTAYVDAARDDARPWRRILTAEDWLEPLPSVGFGSRLPGPDACQPDGSELPRQATADELDEQFAALLLRTGADEAADPVAVVLFDSQPSAGAKATKSRRRRRKRAGADAMPPPEAPPAAPPCPDEGQPADG